MVPYGHSQCAGLSWPTQPVHQGLRRGGQATFCNIFFSRFFLASIEKWICCHSNIFLKYRYFCLVASNGHNKSELLTHSMTLFIIQNMCNFYCRTYLGLSKIFQDFSCVIMQLFRHKSLICASMNKSHHWYMLCFHKSYNLSKFYFWDIIGNFRSFIYLLYFFKQARFIIFTIKLMILSSWKLVFFCVWSKLWILYYLWNYTCSYR